MVVCLQAWISVDTSQTCKCCIHLYTVYWILLYISVHSLAPSSSIFMFYVLKPQMPQVRQRSFIGKRRRSKRSNFMRVCRTKMPSERSILLRLSILSDKKYKKGYYILYIHIFYILYYIYIISYILYYIYIYYIMYIYIIIYNYI